jgi:myosin-5
MMYCWVPDDTNVYRIAEIVSGHGSDEFVVCDYSPNKSRRGPTSKIKASLTYSIFHLDELTLPPSDLIQLTDVHRPGILHTLRNRFEQDIIYTSIGPILVALNPFRWIPGIYDEEIKQLYASGERNLGQNPHVFAMAHDALAALQFGKNQSLLISGESGAGKTEATKQCLNYLATIAGSSSGVQNKILQANPILEAWGNSKTLRNNNSSRFGKFIEIYFSRNGEIISSSNTTYLLEKSRVVFQEQGERNYHIFYQLLFGSSKEVLKEFYLDELCKNPNKISVINQSGCIQIEGVDDHDEYKEVQQAQQDIGFTPLESKTLLQAVAGIIHLANIRFVPQEDNSDASNMVDDGNYLRSTSSLLGIDIEILTQILLYRAVKSGKRKSITYTPHNSIAALENSNSLSKELYSRCFDYIVARINEAINISPVTIDTKSHSSGKQSSRDMEKESSQMIGILDIFGFEIFKKVRILYIINSIIFVLLIIVIFRIPLSNYVSI